MWSDFDSCKSLQLLVKESVCFNLNLVLGLQILKRVVSSDKTSERDREDPNAYRPGRRDVSAFVTSADLEASPSLLPTLQGTQRSIGITVGNESISWNPPGWLCKLCITFDGSNPVAPAVRVCMPACLSVCMYVRMYV